MSNSVSVVIDGMTGVGKTTLQQIVAEEFSLLPYQEIFRDENDLLGKYHTQGKEWCFPMQVSFLNNRYLQYKEACKEPNSIMDRSIFSDPIFAELYRKNGDMKPEEYAVYKGLFNSLVNSLEPPKLIIYLEVDVEEALNRIRKRGREDELHMPEVYWRELHQTYTEYYQDYNLSPLLKLNVTDLDFVKYAHDRLTIIETIQNYLQIAEQKVIVGA